MGVAQIACMRLVTKTLMGDRNGGGKGGGEMHIRWDEGLSDRSMACSLSYQKVSRSYWNEIFNSTVTMFLINAPHPMAAMRKSRSNSCSVFCSTV